MYRPGRSDSSKKRKGNASPYAVPTGGNKSRLARENQSRTPATHQSSPAKPSRLRDAFDDEIQVRLPPASEGRTRPFPSAPQPMHDRRGDPLSSPTVAHRPREVQQSDLLYTEERTAARSRTSLPGKKPAMPTRVDQVRRSPDSHLAPGSSRDSSIAIEVTDSEEEDKENAVKPHTATASARTAHNSGETQSSRPGPSRQDRPRPEANGRRQSIPGEWPDARTHRSHSPSKEEGVDDITQFSRDDEPSRPPTSKGKAKELDQEDPTKQSRPSRRRPRRTEHDSDHELDDFGHSIQPPSKARVPSPIARSTPAGPSRTRRQMQDKDGRSRPSPEVGVEAWIRQC